MRSDIVRVGCYGLALLIAVLSVGSHLMAAVTINAPEIDGSSLSVGLGLLSAGVLILRARRRSKQ
jgi:hypothetical protein